MSVQDSNLRRGRSGPQQHDLSPDQQRSGKEEIHAREGDPAVTRVSHLPMSHDRRDGDVGEDRVSPSTVRWWRMLLMAIVPLAVLAVGYGGYSYLKLTKPDALKQPTTERAFSVRSVVAKSDSYRPMLKLYGSSVSGRQVDIRALVSGEVVATSPQLREGGEVAKGDVLLSIDPFDYENSLVVAQAQVREAQARRAELEASLSTDKTSLEHARAQTKLSETDLARAAPLVKRGAVSKRTADDRRQIVSQRRQAADQLENSISVWTARISQQDASIARLQSLTAVARRRLEQTRLRAPFDAYVRDVSSHVGRMIGANDKVATLIDRDWMEVRFNLTDDQFGRIVSAEGSLVGRSVSVNWVLGGSTFTYKAKIQRLGAQVASSSGGVEVFARIEDPHVPVAIRPGAFVEVLVADKMFQDVFRLPGTSLYDGDTVYVIEKDRLAVRKVKVVGGVGTDLLVGGGLKPDERVLTTRISTPGEGVLVVERDPS